MLRGGGCFPMRILAGVLLLAGCGADMLDAPLQGAADGPPVRSLTGQTFDAALKQFDVILVHWYAPWSALCQQVEPVFEKVAMRMRAQDVVCAKVDVAADSDLADREDISAYPTIKIYTRDAGTGQRASAEFEAASGMWSLADIVSWVLDTVGPAIRDVGVAAMAEVGLIVRSGGSCVVAVMPDGLEDAALDVVEKLARRWRGAVVFMTVSSPIMLGEWATVAQAGQLVLFAAWRTEPFVYKGELEVSAAQLFIEYNRIKPLDEITAANHRTYRSRGLPILHLFLDPRDAQETQQALIEFGHVAETFRGRISCVHLDGLKYRALAQRMGLTGGVLPSVALEDADGGRHYAHSEHVRVSRNPVVAFVRKFFAGELRPSLRSEPPPRQPVDMDGVTVLVGSTLQSVIAKGGTDVLLLLHTPWCTHCARVSPVFAKVAQAVAGVGMVTVAKLDASVNDVTADLSGDETYPRVYFISRGGKARLYDGPLTSAALLAFVAKSAAGRVNASYAPDGVEEEDVRYDPLLHGDITGEDTETALKGEHLHLRERVKLLEATIRSLQRQVADLSKKLRRRSAADADAARAAAQDRQRPAPTNSGDEL